MGPNAEKIGNRFTYNDYVLWPEDERWEAINGEAYAMTPAPVIQHQLIAQYLGTELGVSSREAAAGHFLPLLRPTSHGFRANHFSADFATAREPLKKHPFGGFIIPPRS